MPTAIYALPDTPQPAGVSTTPADGGWLSGAWSEITGAVANTPDWVWAVLVALLIAGALATFPLLRAQARKAGARTAGSRSAEDARDRRLLIGALVPAVLFWTAVLVGSGRGLIAFGRDDLKWTDGWEYLIPLTLDGVAISFGLLAFRAVGKQRNPDRATRIAWGAMLASAGLNFFHEVGGSSLGAIYLAILSLLGMLIFHEFLAQFEEGADWIKRENPKFGLRWFTWPTNTLCAWIAWRNHPLEAGTDATINLAVANLEKVRRAKRAARAARLGAGIWWMRFAPWAHIGALQTALAEQRTAAESERSRLDARNADIDRLIRDHDNAMREQADRLRSETEQVRSTLTEQLETERAEHAAQVTRIREKSTTAPAGTPARSSAKTTAPAAGGDARLSNDQAVELMLRTHPEPGYEWGTREVSRLTGAGFGRVPKLIAAVAEHHTRNAGTGVRNTPEDDAKEQSA